MGKPRTVDMSVDLDTVELEEIDKKAEKKAKQQAKAKAKAEPKIQPKADKPGAEKTTKPTKKAKETPDTETSEKDKKEKVDIQAKIDAKIEANIEKAKAPPKTARARSKRYVTARRRIDRTKEYPLTKAVKLLLETSYSTFPGTVVADVVIKDKHRFFKVGKTYESLTYNGATYTIADYENGEKPIGSAFFERID